MEQDTGFEPALSALVLNMRFELASLILSVLLILIQGKADVLAADTNPAYIGCL